MSLLSVFGYALRFIAGGGRRSIARSAFIALGAIVGVVVILLAVSIPVAVQRSVDKQVVRFPDRTADDSGDPLVAVVPGSWGRQRFDQLLYELPLMPPGLEAPLRAGEAAVSPALARLIEDNESAAPPVPGVIVGEISSAGLLNPSELYAYVAFEDLSAFEGSFPASGFGSRDQNLIESASGGLIASQLLFMVLAPSVLYLVTCARLSSEARDRRWRAMSLVGAGRRLMRRIAFVEGALIGFVGAAVGTLVFRIVAGPLGESELLGLSWFAEDIRAGWFLPLLVLLLSTVGFGYAGASQVSTAIRPTQTRHARVRRIDFGVIRYAPFALGVSLLAGVAIQAGFGRVAASSDWIMALGVLLAVGGLPVVLTPLVQTLGTRMGRLSGLSLHLAGKRLAAQPRSTIRVLSGLMLLLIVFQIGSGVLADGRFALGEQTTRTWLNAPFSELPNAPQLDEAVASVSIEYAEDPDNNVRTVIYAPCAEILRIDANPSPSCRDNAVYRFERSDIAYPNELLPGLKLTLGPDGLVVPSETITVDAIDTYLPVDSILVTSSRPAGLDDSYSIVGFVIPNERLEQTQASLANANPSARFSSSFDVDRAAALTTYENVTTLGTTLGFMLGFSAFVIASVDRALEQKRSSATLAAIGASARQIRASNMLSFAFPAVVTLAVAIALGNLCAHTYLASLGSNDGWYGDPIFPSVILGGAALALAVVAGAAIRVPDEPALTLRAD